MILCMSIVPGYSGQAFMPEALGRIEELADSRRDPDPGRRRRRRGERGGRAGRGCDACSSPATRSSPTPDPAAAYRRIAAAAA